MTNFSVATSDRVKNKDSGEYEPRTQWHKITSYNPSVIDFVSRFVR